MHVHINQARRNHQAGDVDDPIPGFSLELPDRRNDSAVNANVSD
jgi:hypothetical protein